MRNIFSHRLETCKSKHGRKEYWNKQNKTDAWRDVTLPYLYLLHLLLVVDVHLLERVLQLLVAFEESLAELRSQMQV